MKSFFCLLLVVTFIPATAQKVVINSSAKGSDLAITELRLIEASRNPATGLHKIKVSVTIKNNGDAPAVATSLKMLVQNHLLNLVAPPNPQPQNPWHQLGESQPVSSIAPGQPLTAEYLFTETRKVITTNRFNMGVMADAGNLLKEMNETDNRSLEIIVTPVDKVEYVVDRTIRPTAQLAKVDTFEYTIGRADFHLQLKEITNEGLQNFFQTYLQLNPHGITIKKLGADNAIKNVTLVAPLHLPANAVIKKVKFNYIKLPGTDIVPHLVLRSNHLTTPGNEGWGDNTPITSYWLNSDTRDGSAGYKVKSSITNAGFSVRTLAASTYYFEILGGDARSTATPQESLWPNSDKIFIWSIQVYYILN